MPDEKVDTVESDAAAASVSNEKAISDASGSKEKDEKPEPSAQATGAAAVPQADSGPTEPAAAENGKVEDQGLAANGKAEKETKPESPQKRQREDDGQRGGRPFKKYKRGNMFDPTVQDITDDPFAIRKQVEFYFSDANLARDKFLFDKVGGSKNDAIDIKTIHSFKRMRRFQPYEAVVKALKESEILEVTDDEKLKRKTPLPANLENKTLEEVTKVIEDESMARTVYVKGFGFEKPSTQFDIEAWFSNYGTTNQVRLRRFDDKTFKGSVFAEFDSEETLKKFLALDPKPKFNDRDLIIQSKKQYCDEKVQAIKDGVIEPDGKGGYRRTDRGSKGNDNRDWRERREEDQKNGFRGSRRGGRDHRGRGRGGRGGFDRRERGQESSSKNNEKQSQQGGGHDTADTDGNRDGETSKVETSKPEAEVSV